MDLQIKGKTALVTGSTAGIGLAIARRLVTEGANVIITGRDQDKLDEAARSLTGPGTVRAILGDAGTAQGVEAIIAHADSIDILVNNLGIYEAKPFDQISDADWTRFFEVNVMSGVRLSRHYFPKMLAQNWGRIIFISSESGLLTPGEMIHYGMTKTAQLAIARGLADQTKGTGVTVNSVLPGPTRSAGIYDFMRGAMDKPDASEAELEGEFFDKLRPLSLIRRLIDADEIGNMVAFLSSPLAAVTNGAAIRAEGGILPTIA